MKNYKNNLSKQLKSKKNNKKDNKKKWLECKKNISKKFKIWKISKR